MDVDFDNKWQEDLYWLCRQYFTTVRKMAELKSDAGVSAFYGQEVMRQNQHNKILDHTCLEREDIYHITSDMPIDDPKGYRWVFGNIAKVAASKGKFKFEKEFPVNHKTRSKETFVVAGHALRLFPDINPTYDDGGGDIKLPDGSWPPEEVDNDSNGNS
jgi:hypothetical protein